MADSTTISMILSLAFMAFGLVCGFLIGDGIATRRHTRNMREELRIMKAEATQDMIDLFCRSDKIYTRPVTLYGSGQRIENCTFLSDGQNTALMIKLDDA